MAPDDNTVHLHPFESLHFLAFRFNYLFLTHVSLRIPRGQPFICDPIWYQQHSHRVNLQSELRSVPVSQVAPHHRSRYFRRVSVSHCIAVLSQYVRLKPLLEEAPGEIGIEVKLNGVKPDGTVGNSGGVNVSSALRSGSSPDWLSTSMFYIPSTRMFFVSVSSAGGPGTNPRFDEALLEWSTPSRYTGSALLAVSILVRESFVCAKQG